jgi:uncharacterized protein YhaN
MKILRLHIDGFGCLHDRDIDFAPGLNLVIGPNEAGKSTLLHCLAQVLTGKPSKHGSFPDCKPWDGRPFAAWVLLEQDGVQYKLVRRFSERGQKAVALSKVAGDEDTVVTQDAREVQKWLAAAFGTGDDTIFYKVFCLSQADLGPMAENADLHEQLERAISGGDVAVTAALQAVDGRFRALTKGEGGRGNPATRGPLQKAVDQRDDFAARLAEAQRQDSDLAEARAQQEALADSLAHGRARIEELKALLDQQKARRALQKQRDDVQAEWDGLEAQREQVETLTAECARLRSELQQVPAEYADPAALRTRLAGAEAARERADKYAAEKTRLTGALAALPAAVKTPGARAAFDAARQRRDQPTGYVVAGALAIMGIMMLLTSWFIALIVLGVAGVVALVTFFTKKRGSNGLPALCQAWGIASPEEAERLLNEADALRQQMAAVELALKESGETAPGADDAAQWLSTIETLQSQLTSAEGSLKVLPGVDDLVAQRRPLTRRKTEIEDQVADLPGAALSVEEETRLSLEQQGLQGKIAGWEREFGDVDKRIAVLENTAKELVSLEDGHAYWAAEAERLQEEREVLALATRWLTAAGQQAHTTIARPLEQRITPLFAAMTGGHYPAVHVRSEGKQFDITPADGAVEVAVDQLSRGTRDQLALAVRLALGEAIAGAGEPLYLLDDPLLHFDADRRREALAVLASFCTTRQVILVTHDEELIVAAGAAATVIRCAPLAAVPAGK